MSNSVPTARTRAPFHGDDEGATRVLRHTEQGLTFDEIDVSAASVEAHPNTGAPIEIDRGAVRQQYRTLLACPGAVHVSGRLEIERHASDGQQHSGSDSRRKARVPTSATHATAAGRRRHRLTRRVDRHHVFGKDCRASFDQRNQLRWLRARLGMNRLPDRALLQIGAHVLRGAAEPFLEAAARRAIRPAVAEIDEPLGRFGVDLLVHADASLLRIR